MPSERERLLLRFEDRMAVGDFLSRPKVSWQLNRELPGLRWFRYKEGFSAQLVTELLELAGGYGRMLDPFAGVGTAPLTAAQSGWSGTGVELMPAAALAFRAMAAAAMVRRADLRRGSREMMRVARNGAGYSMGLEFPHIRTTAGAFSAENEQQVVAVREWLSDRPQGPVTDMLRLAAMAALEDASWTIKDGQYLRWDHRSGRKLRSQVEKKRVLSYVDSLSGRLRMMDEDLPAIGQGKGILPPVVQNQSVFVFLSTEEDDAYDAVVTSPPYANRYDYTRTYALELAWLGHDQQDVSALRQRLLSATVENHSKREWLAEADADASAVADNLPALREILELLEGARERDELPNPQVIRLVENYFLELAFVISQLSRVCRSGASVFMVNDNVRYHGEEVPVDLMLSAVAEELGFHTEAIWTLPRGKGNSSQQMRQFGRQELRKCVYHWRRT